MSERHYGVIVSGMLMAGSLALAAVALKVGIDSKSISDEAMQASRSNAELAIKKEEFGFASRVDTNSAIAIRPKELAVLRSENAGYKIDTSGIEIANYNQASLEMYVYGAEYRGEDASHDASIKIDVPSCTDVRIAKAWQGVEPDLPDLEGVAVSSMYFVDYAHRTWVMNPSKLPAWLQGGIAEPGPENWMLASGPLADSLQNPDPGSHDVISVKAIVVTSVRVSSCTPPSEG